MTKRLVVQVLIAGVLALLVVLLSPPSGAEMVYRFEPSLELLLLHDGDVFRTSLVDEVSDESARLQAVLPLVGESERTSWRLVYAPEAEFFRTYSDLDRLDHRAELGFSRDFSERSSWDVGGVYLDTSDALNEFLVDEIITTRSDRQLLSANTLYDVGVSRRVDLSFYYDFRDLEYKDPIISGYSTHVAGLEASYAAGERTDLALDYNFQWFLYEITGDFLTHNILGHYIVRPSEESTLDLAAGVYLQQFSPAEEDLDDPEYDGNSNGFIGGISWNRRGRRLNFEAGLDRQVRATGGINQSLLSHSLTVRLGGEVSRKLHLDLSGVARRSEPTLPGQTGEVDVLRAGFDLDYHLTDHLDAGIFVDYIVQRWKDPLRRDLDYPRAGVRLAFSVGHERP